MIGLSKGLYLAVLSLPFGEILGWCRVRQFLKHQIHAEVVLVWLIIVRYVSSLVLTESLCFLAVLNGAEVTVSESLELS